MRHIFGQVSYLPFFAPEGDDSGAGDGGGKKQEPSGLTKEQFEAFSTGMANLQKTMGDVGAGIQQLMSEARNARKADSESHEEDLGGGDNELDESALETMPRRQFMDLLQANFSKALEGQLKPLREEIGKANVTAQAGNMRVEAEKVMNEHPDFVDFKDEMVSLGGQHPTLGVRQLYNLARMEHPAKAAELDKKYSDEKKKKEKAAADAAAEEAKKNKKPFALTPGGSTEGTQRNKRMNATDAAKAAWDETVSRLGFVPFS